MKGSCMTRERTSVDCSFFSSENILVNHPAKFITSVVLYISMRTALYKKYEEHY